MPRKRRITQRDDFNDRLREEKGSLKGKDFEALNRRLMRLMGLTDRREHRRALLATFTARDKALDEDAPERAEPYQHGPLKQLLEAVHRLHDSTFDAVFNSFEHPHDGVVIYKGHAWAASREDVIAAIKRELRNWPANRPSEIERQEVFANALAAVFQEHSRYSRLFNLREYRMRLLLFIRLFCDEYVERKELALPTSYDGLLHLITEPLTKPRTRSRRR
jgi:hypothetical protein